MSYMLKEARESAAIVANQDTSQALALAEALKAKPRAASSASPAAPPTTPSATSATSSCTRAAWRSPLCRRP